MMQSLLRLIRNTTRNVSAIDVFSLALFLFIVVLTAATFIYPPATRLDFAIYLMAAKSVMQKLTLYPQVYTPVSFLYPPSALVIFFPFLFVSLPVAASIWNTISLFAIAASSCLLLLFIKKPIRIAFLFLFLSCVLVTEPVRETLLFGQNNGVILFLLLLSFLFSRKNTAKHHMTSGIFLGVAIALKLFPLLLLLYFLNKKQWQTSLVALITFFLFLFMGTLGNLGYIKEYMLYVFAIIGTHSFSLSDQSFSSLFLFIFPALRAFQVSATVAVYSCFVIFCFFLRKKLQNNTFSDFFFFSSILGSTILVITPMAWVHHLIFLLPLCFALLWQAMEKKNIFLVCLFLITTLILLLNGEDATLLLHSMRLQEMPLLYFHGLAGLCFALVGELVYLHFSNAQK